MKKTFDCVEMKNEIQRKRQAEYKGLSLEARKALMEKHILSNPNLAPMYRRAMEKNGQRHLRVAEEAPEYGTRKGTD